MKVTIDFEMPDDALNYTAYTRGWDALVLLGQIEEDFHPETKGISPEEFVRIVKDRLKESGLISLSSAVLRAARR